MPDEGAIFRLSVEPRRWQNEALRLWARVSRGIVRVVTGGGKTVFAELCMLSFLGEYPHGRITIIVPTIALLDQWYVSLREDLGVPDAEIACFSGESRPSAPAKVNVFVLNTARSTAPPISAETDSMLVVDECHRAGSLVNSRALAGSYRATLGLSATPEREYDLGLELALVPRLGDVIFEYDYVQARRDGVISRFELVNVAAPLLPHEQREYDRLSRLVARARRTLSPSPETAREHMTRLLRQRASVGAQAVARIPVALRLLEDHRGQQAILFHERIGAAETLLRLLNERGYKAAIYHSRVNPVLRRDNLRLYRRGLFDVLVTCRALDEGLNVPETEVAVIASSTASTRQRIQRLGRLLRPAKDKEKATIYTVYTTKPEEERLRIEASALQEVASVRWRRSHIPIHDTHSD